MRPLTLQATNHPGALRRPPTPFAAVAAAAAVFTCVTGMAHASVRALSDGENAPPPSTRAVLVVVADRLTADDVHACPRLAELLQRATVGLVSPSATGRRTPEAVYASASAGGYAGDSPLFSQAFNVDEDVAGTPAASIYQRRTGILPARHGTVNTGAAAAAGISAALSTPVRVGALGQALRDARCLRAAFGNSDMPGAPRRLAAALFSDLQGLIPLGDVSARCNKKDPLAAGGLRTDMERLASLAAPLLQSGVAVTIEFGDLERLEQERDAFSGQAYCIARRNALDRLADGIAAVRQRVPDAPVVLLALVPPSSAQHTWNRPGFAAVMADDFHPGLLTSPTTRTAGLIAAIDAGPTILSLARVPQPQQMLGTAASWESSAEPYHAISAWEQTILLNERLAMPVILGLGVLAMAAAILALLYITGALTGHTMGRLAAVSLATIAWIPVVLLVPLDCPAVYLLLPPAVAGSFVAASVKPQRLRFLPIELPAAALLAGVMLSAAGTLDWVQRSVLSSFQMNGLRFYGIGNEFMGCVIGAAAAIPLWRYGRRRTSVPLPALGLWFLFWVVVLGLPILGANFGGAIGSFATFALVCHALADRPVRFRTAVAAAAGAVCIAMAFAILDHLLQPSAPTHMGRAIAGVGSGHFANLLGIIRRKAMMNVTLWTRTETLVAIPAFAAVIAAAALARKRLAKHLDIPPRLGQGLVAIGWGSAITMAFNDSGLVSIAFVFCYVVVWLLWEAATRKSGGLPVLKGTHANTVR